MIITNLRGCLLRNPLGIDAATPELSWEFEEPEPGSSRQAAWRVCVASRADRLDSPDLWDSGRVENSRTAFIAYGGLPLTSRMECHWRVEAWDESGNRLVSAPAFWTMGLLSRSDWSAHWIGLDAATENPKPWFGSAQWIWSADTKPAAWTFETAFEIEPSELEALREPLLEVLADDEAEVFFEWPSDLPRPAGPCEAQSLSRADSVLDPEGGVPCRHKLPADRSAETSRH